MISHCFNILMVYTFSLPYRSIRGSIFIPGGGASWNLVSDEQKKASTPLKHNKYSAHPPPLSTQNVSPPRWLIYAQLISVHGHICTTYKYEKMCCHLRLKVSHTSKQQLTLKLGTELSIAFYIYIHQKPATKHLNCIPYFFHL